MNDLLCLAKVLLLAFLLVVSLLAGWSGGGWGLECCCINTAFGVFLSVSVSVALRKAPQIWTPSPATPATRTPSGRRSRKSALWNATRTGRKNALLSTCAVRGPEVDVFMFMFMLLLLLLVVVLLLLLLLLLLTFWAGSQYSE